MDDQRELRIEDKIDKMSEHLSSIDITLAKQHISLDDHIRRTATLEDAMLPIKENITMIKGILWFVGALGGLAAFCEACVLVLDYISKK